MSKSFTLFMARIGHTHTQRSIEIGGRLAINTRLSQKLLCAFVEKCANFCVGMCQCVCVCVCFAEDSVDLLKSSRSADIFTHKSKFKRVK